MNFLKLFKKDQIELTSDQEQELEEMKRMVYFQELKLRMKDKAIKQAREDSK